MHWLVRRLVGEHGRAPCGQNGGGGDGTFAVDMCPVVWRFVASSLHVIQPCGHATVSVIVI